MHAPHAPLLLLCYFFLKKKNVQSSPSLSNGTGTFRAFLFQALRRDHLGWLCSSVLLTSRINQEHRNLRQAQSRPSSNLRSVHAQNRHRRQIPSQLRCHLETALPKEWHKLSASLGSSCKGTRLDVSGRKSPPTASEFAPPFTWPSLHTEF